MAIPFRVLGRFYMHLILQVMAAGKAVLLTRSCPNDAQRKRQEGGPPGRTRAARCRQLLLCWGVRAVSGMMDGASDCTGCRAGIPFIVWWMCGEVSTRTAVGQSLCERLPSCVFTTMGHQPWSLMLHEVTRHACRYCGGFLKF